MQFSHRFYYAVKPLLPWRLRMAARRFVALRARERTRDVWPIKASAGTKPPGWTHWPEQKQFALVLTHDVEGPEGLAQIRRLAEVEMELGFRSCFNLIPAGPYAVPADLRHWLVSNGFEVGVHDLHHDGTLFSGRHGFNHQAKRINQHLKDWGAVGFRAGFMLRNLDWIHDLEIQYDASTFDTDPFEPQSDGTDRIFPFWISQPAPAGSSAASIPRRAADGTLEPFNPKGYVELPYTLPQDSTLFLLLKEKSPAIWINKLDWLAQKGGMALVNVHPDYINFGPGPDSSRQYSIEHYASLLRHAKANYAGAYWNPLPRDLAKWYASIKQPGLPVSLTSAQASGQENAPAPAQPPSLKGKRVAVILYSRYPADPRPRRAAEAMIGAGMAVDLYCLSDSPTDPRTETVNGVNVFRSTLKHRRESKWVYLWQYGRFLTSAFWFLFHRGLTQRYDLVHVHNMPDFLVFSSLVPRLRGAKVILDLHDPMPELMESIYQVASSNWKISLLRRIEKWSIGFSHLVLTPNITFKHLFGARSCDPDKIRLVMNSPQEEIFSRPAGAHGVDEPAEDGEFRVMHHGLIAHRHGVDLLVEAIALLRPSIPEIRLDLYGGTTPFLSTVLGRAAELGASDLVRYHGPKSQVEIAAAIRRCHVGVVPNRRSVFTEVNFPTRLFEYLAMGRPVIAPDTRGIRDYFTADDMLLFQPGSAQDLAERIRAVYLDRAMASRFVQRGTEVYRRHLWRDEKRRFISYVADLLPAK